MSLKNLRKIAELNLCEDCYEKYKALLEPTIEKWLFNPLRDWRDVESCITRMVMKSKGVFKSDLIFISIDEDSNKFANEVDVKTFREIKKWAFKRKIDYLKKEGILGDSSYNFLDRVRKIRNRIHELFNEFSEQDLALFSLAREVTFQIYNATMFNLGDAMSKNIKSNAEKVAKHWLSKINDKWHFGDSG